MKFGISVYTKSPDTRSLGALQAPTSSLWPFGRSGRVMMIASYTYVCTMHVKNGTNKQTDGKLNSRSRIWKCEVQFLGNTGKFADHSEIVELDS